MTAIFLQYINKQKELILPSLKMAYLNTNNELPTNSGQTQ